MASNQVRYVGNMFFDKDGSMGPLTMLGLFQSGATQAVKRGELLELTADTNTRWTPMDSDFAMAFNVAIAAEEIISGDRAGYYEIHVPRPGDLWEFDLAAAGATALGTDLYWSDSETVTVTTGANILGDAAGQQHYPLKQGHLANDGGPDRGETIKSQSKVIMTIREAASYFGLLQA